MLLIAFLASTFAAALNAASSVLQRLAAGKPRAREIFSRRFAAQVSTNRNFLAGMGLQLGGFLSQATALHFGPLVLVQPVLTLDLVFLLPLLRYKLGVKVASGEWLAVAAICLGLGGLFFAARPHGGTYTYALLPWAIIVSVAIIFIAAVIFSVRRIPSPKVRALLTALATSVTYSLNAVSTKLGLNLLLHGGIIALLTSWPMYLLIVSGILSLYLMANMYGAGPLAISQPVLEIGEPAISATLGIVIFGETIRLTPWAIAGEVVSGLVLTAGVIALASSKKIRQAATQGV